MFNLARKQSRLSQWNGRRRSSRGDELLVSPLWNPPALLRVATVLTTMLAATFLAYRWGPPMPYRMGEVYPNDLRVRAYFEVINQPETELAREAHLAIGQPQRDEEEDHSEREERRIRAQPDHRDRF